MVRFLVTALNSGAYATNTYPGAGVNLGDNPADPQTETYTLWEPDGLTLPAPLPSSTGTKTDTNNSTFTLVGSWNYLVAKFGQDSEAFWIGNLAPGEYTIPNLTGNTNGISNYTLINGGTSVPDGGTTALLLGAGLIVLSLAGRRFSSIAV
jgi:hypothetical protein